MENVVKFCLHIAGIFVNHVKEAYRSCIPSG